MKESNKMGVILDATGFGVQLTDYGYEKIIDAKKAAGFNWCKEFIRDIKNEKVFRTDKLIIDLVESNYEDMLTGVENTAPIFRNKVSIHYIDLDSPIWKNIDFVTDSRVQIEEHEAAGFVERIVIQMHCSEKEGPTIVQ